MRQELEQLTYDDAIVMLFSMCEQYGPREVFTDFRNHFPEMFEEIVVQINRIGPRPAALLR